MIDLNVRVLTDLTLRFLPAMVAGKVRRDHQRGVHRGIHARAHDGGLFCHEELCGEFRRCPEFGTQGHGVTLTTLCPGTVKTGFQARAGQNERGSTLSAFDVASQGWAGFKAKRRVVIPGIFNQMVAYGLRLTPRRISLPFIKQVMGRRRAT